MSMVQNDGYHEVVWPRGARQVGRKSFAPRLKTLDSMTIAQLWTFGFRGDQVFEALEEGLKSRFPGIRFINWREFGSILGANQRQFVADLPERLKRLGVDAVVTGMAC